MNTCETYSPADSATVRVTDEKLVLRLSHLRIGFTIMKPLSQKTGTEMIHPMSMIASCGCFSPITRMIASARRIAAPVFSRMRPMRVPKMITIPMLVKIEENPFPIVVGMVSSGMPIPTARMRAIPMIARNGWMPHFEIDTISSTIASAKTIIRVVPVSISVSV